MGVDVLRPFVIRVFNKRLFIGLSTHDLHTVRYWTTNMSMVDSQPERNSAISKKLLEQVTLICNVAQSLAHHVEKLRGTLTLVTSDMSVLVPRLPHKYSRRITATEKEGILEARKAGHSYDQIAAAYGYNKSSIARLCQRNGEPKEDIRESEIRRQP